MSPMLKYRDPADGLWKPVPVGGVQNPVGMNDLTDADTAASAPTVGDALVWDGTNWVPSGPAVVVPPTPAAGGEAARYVDAIPRFADVVTRDAFYGALAGGPQEGMQCYVLSLGLIMVFDGVSWVSLVLHTGRQSGSATRTITASLTNNTAYDVSYTTYGPGSINPPNLVLDSTQNGVVTIDEQLFLLSIYAALTAPTAAATLSVAPITTIGSTISVGTYQYFYINPNTVHSDFRITYITRVRPGAGATIGARVIPRGGNLTMTNSSIFVDSI